MFQLDLVFCYISTNTWNKTWNTWNITCYCQYTKMGSNNNDILEGLSIIDKYVQITINKLNLLK